MIVPGMESRVLHRGAMRLRLDGRGFGNMSVSNEVRVSEAWNRALCVNPAMFDGTLFCCSGIEVQGREAVVSGGFARYSRYVAGLMDPEFPRVIPVAVSGVVLADVGGGLHTLLGVRGPFVTTHRSLLELIPSGSVDASCVDARGDLRHRDALLKELHEETAIGPDQDVDICDFAVVWDGEAGTLELGCLIRVGQAVDAGLLRSEGNEYRSSFLVPLGEASRRLESEESVEASKLLMRLVLAEMEKCDDL